MRSQNMLKIATLLMPLAMLAGCASSDEWAKPGATREQANKDSADCLFDAQTVRGAGAAITVDQVKYRQCMANKGYTSTK
jgi:starvation-inducible outer membrane lipoprotein